MTTEYEIDTPGRHGVAWRELNRKKSRRRSRSRQIKNTYTQQRNNKKLSILSTPPKRRAENAEEEEPAPPKRDPVIPRARFDEVNAKLHAAREEAEQLRAALAERQQEQASRQRRCG
jgi:hypothetical protein